MIKPIKAADIPKKKGNHPPYVADALRDFMETSALAGEIRIPEGRTARSVAQTYRTQIRRMNLPLKVTERNGHAYIEKKGLKK